MHQLNDIKYKNIYTKENDKICLKYDSQGNYEYIINNNYMKLYLISFVLKENASETY